MKIENTFIQKQQIIHKEPKKELEIKDTVTLSKSPISEKVLIIAHRGSSKLAPENTMASFKEAYKHGATAIELDTHRTKDGYLVIIHDDTLDRTTNGHGKVGDFTLKELKELDAGSWFGPEFKGEKIPTLEEVLQWAKGKVKVDIEVKNSSQYPGIEKDILKLVEEKDLKDDVFITSFDKSVSENIKDMAPEIKTGLLISPDLLVKALKIGTAGGLIAGLAGSLIGGAGALLAAGMTLAGGGMGFLVSKEIGERISLKGSLEEKADIILPYWALIGSTFVRKAHEKNKEVYSYTANSPKLVNKLANKTGVDGIITDTPEKFLEGYFF
ncbi:MAG TPA: glycerophosphodiester phosphodiesterase family protein [Candidatus Eremiobacteraeota bacterium]|nr:MAG: Glycerophosphoryl diester phosphodiesterase [bacterium ADurb.Bin363]HPZ07042.1 glycerophosphodiester phosphodiesterase family protein [Candidatus Eremiobacteraeota bacterium]